MVIKRLITEKAENVDALDRSIYNAFTQFALKVVQGEKKKLVGEIERERLHCLLTCGVSF